MEADKQAIRHFFERMHGPEPAGWLMIWTRQDKATQAFDLGQPDVFAQAVEYCATRAVKSDVYAAVGLQHQRPPNRSRGGEAGVIALPGVWADVDVRSTAHKTQDLPPTEEDAHSLVASLGFEPSIVVRTGFGLQVYWLFRQPYRIHNDDERQHLKSLSTRFQANLRQRANERGWALDSTSDLCRLLRVPGTFNRKIVGDVRQVTAEYGEYAYDPDDYEGLLAETPHTGPRESQAPLAVDMPPAKLPPILDGCAWMRHCRDDAVALPEPEWYRMLTVIARCSDAERWAHDFSKPHPQYSKRETQRKLKQASGDHVAPVTCVYVQSDLNGAPYCAECLFRGNVNSPITIGRIEDAESEAEAESVPVHTPTADEPALSKATATRAARIEKYTDLGNAKRFVERYRGSILYCEAWSKWFLWDTKRWHEDEKLAVFIKAAELIRGLYPRAMTIKDEKQRKAFLDHLQRSESHRALSSMVTLAKSDASVARHPDDFDAYPWLLKVANGTVNLRTGQLQPPDPKNLITKLAPVVYDPAANCPNWLEFLNMIMSGSAPLIAFLQRAFGVTLTGITSEKAMYILYGPGGDNGKSTMIDVMQRILGDYARRTPAETFLRKREGSIPNDVARLKGARFVWAAENERGSRLSESLIKEMTGGDKMTARFMRGEFFEFMPEFKLWFATNHKPTVRGDQAIWRRLKLIPFHVSIPVAQQKPRHEVMEMFAAEHSGILNWAIQGCLEWQRNGLGVPEEVVEATREYEAEQDTFTMFLEDECVRVPNARVASIALYCTYKRWAEEHGEVPVSHKAFASLMSEHGFQKSRNMAGVTYSGIGLRAEAHYDAPARPAVPRFAQGEDGEEV